MRLIDAGAFMENLIHCDGLGRRGLEAVLKTIKEQPTAYNNGWIACSERLPEVNGWYLVTNELGVVHQQYWGASHWQKLRDDAVVAWRELPEPYQPKGE